MGNIKSHTLHQNCSIYPSRPIKPLLESHLIGPNGINFKKMTPKTFDTEEDIYNAQ